jgi:hypothetical protein
VRCSLEHARTAYAQGKGRTAVGQGTTCLQALIAKRAARPTNSGAAASRRNRTAGSVKPVLCERTSEWIGYSATQVAHHIVGTDHWLARLCGTSPSAALYALKRENPPGESSQRQLHDLVPVSTKENTPTIRGSPRVNRRSLEPISKSPKEDDEAS